MAKYSSDIEQLIYEKCYSLIFEEANRTVAANPLILDLSYSKLKYPNTASIEDMLLEFSRNINIIEDTLSFDAVLSCTILLSEFDEYSGEKSCETKQWLAISCSVLIEDRIKKLLITDIKPYARDISYNKPAGAILASKNIVPIVHRKDLETEATRFLEKYCPEALEYPMQVPIEEIATEQLGLHIEKGHRLTDDFSVFGQICFSKASVHVWDLFQCNEETLDVDRGTIFVDAYTFWERNTGCVNNTIAHEVYHWYRHRLYAAVRQILLGEKVIACRCPSNITYPSEEEEWTDEQRMEWQANNVAPRILMPISQFKKKVTELLKLYDYKNTPLKLAVMECIANDLASFYGVSRQSAIIRMIETGFKEAIPLNDYDKDSKHISTITSTDAFIEYSSNKEFRELIDSGKFMYVDGYYTINDSKYIEEDGHGGYTLSDYAWEHLDECTLRFTLRRIDFKSEERLPLEIFHRANGAANKNVPQFDSSNNASVLALSEELQHKRTEFEKQNRRYMMSRPGITCWEYVFNLIQDRGWNKLTFSDRTLLGYEVYSKAKNNHSSKPDIRTIVAIACGLDLDLTTTTEILRLAGHAFDDSDEHRALSFCISGFPGCPIEERNEFLESYGFRPLGTKERY